jgi:hypothetical protein
MYSTFSTFGTASKVNTETLQTTLIANFKDHQTHIAGIGIVLSCLYASSWGDRGKLGELSGSYKQEKKAGSVDSVFWKRVTKLIKVAIPSWTSKEARYIYLLMLVIAMRTYMSIYLAESQGRIVKTIIQ